ncbi:MAG: thymidine phosphorylase [Bacilli bacterium]|nr:thymidine phosphorylase [Bacilli bacterium]
MTIVEIINKKKNKKELTKKEIYYFVNGYCDGSIKDYQASSLLMAIRLNGMSEKETFNLTKAIINSGKMFDLSNIDGIKVDKHSTGGVGDKTSLVLVPLLASLGFKVAKMSGRGLGHTGGTIDKLDSITGFKTEVSEEDFVKQVNDVGCSIIAQSSEIALADKKLYALRDVTGTVDSLPLIASSIMSKKIALGSDVICLDVKVGNGAFFKTKKEALTASKLMIKIGKACGVKVRAIITSMDEPLGYNIGNKLEVQESIDTLLGKGPKDLENICIEICKIFIKETGLYPKETDLDSLIKGKIESGEAYQKLVDMVNAQHGSLPIKLDENLTVTEIRSNKEGYITKINTLDLGNMLVELGGGRKYKEQEINYDVGFAIHKKMNEYIKENDLLFTVYSTSPLSEKEIKEFQTSINVSNKPNLNYKEIYKIL